MDGDERAALNDLIARFRRAHTAIAVARPPAAVWRRAGALLDQVSALLEPHAVDEEHRITGQVREYPGRGQALVPALRRLEQDETHVVATFCLEPFYLGRGAAHGGVLPLIFDEILGQLVNLGSRARARTAYLHVNFRAVTPIGRELTVAGRLDRVDGRKRFAVAEVRDGETLLADAEGLFVELRPGQP